MKISIASIGSRDRRQFDDLAGIYLDRLGMYVPGSGMAAGAEAVVYRSEQALLEAAEKQRGRTGSVLVLLDGRGKQMSSEQLAEWLGRQRDEGRQRVIFAVGPADGWTDEARKRAGLLLSLGPMTLPHELARVVICEQIYRAFTILAGHPYHRE